MFININKYTFSYVTFLIVKKKKEGGWTRAVVSDDIVFLQKFKKNENLLEMYFISPFFSNSSVQEETLVCHVYWSCNCS